MILPPPRISTKLIKLVSSYQIHQKVHGLPRQELLELSKNEAFEALKLGSVAGAEAKAAFKKLEPRGGNGRWRGSPRRGWSGVNNQSTPQEREFIKWLLWIIMGILWGPDQQLRIRPTNQGIAGLIFLIDIIVERGIGLTWMGIGGGGMGETIYMCVKLEGRNHETGSVLILGWYL